MADRNYIVRVARMYLGAHYLWGAAGARPGRTDGAWYRPGSVTFATPSLEIKDCAVFAAQCTVDGTYVCAGRYMNIKGGRAADDVDWDLHHYLDGMKNLPPSAWSPYYTYYTPRRVKGSGVTHKIVWGEDCRGKRHFDCISFINMVLSDATHSPWHNSISQLRARVGASPKESAKLGGSLERIDKAAPNVDGDLLFRGDDHIAFLCADGRVIQAQDHAYGVHEREMYHPAKWTDRGRLNSSDLWD